MWSELSFAVAWLGAGMVLFRAGPAYLAMVLPWLVYVFMLRFFALQPPLRAFLIAGFASALITLPIHATWYGSGMPDAGWAQPGIAAALAGALAAFPYLAQRLVAREYPRFWAAFVFPLAVIVVESQNAFNLFSAGGPTTRGLPTSIWMLGAQGVMRTFPDTTIPELFGMIFLLALSAAVVEQFWERMSPL